jgi:hypothetical protein
MPAKVSGSAGEMPYSMLRMATATPSASGTPTATPASVSRSAWRSTSATTSREPAPSATRTPISCVRMATRYAVTA